MTFSRVHTSRNPTNLILLNVRYNIPSVAAYLPGQALEGALPVIHGDDNDLSIQPPGW